MAKNLLDKFLEMDRVNQKRFVKVINSLQEDLGNIELPKVYKKYDEIDISGDKYFVLDVRENEIDVCSKNVLSVEDIKKYFKDKWYLSSSDPIAVRYNSDIRNNNFEDSYIYSVLNNEFKEDKLKSLKVIGDVRLLTKEEVESLDDEHKKSNDWYWTMTPYNDMNELEYGQCARVFYVRNDGYLGNASVHGANIGLRPVITLRTDEL